ncbi:MAG TPA: hypothetical protein PK095_11585 [Myxococcota bacterium]|nr:hypothetical protein [Myxococcota bacterium]
MSRDARLEPQTSTQSTAAQTTGQPDQATEGASRDKSAALRTLDYDSQLAALTPAENIKSERTVDHHDGQYEGRWSENKRTVETREEGHGMTREETAKRSQTVGSGGLSQSTSRSETIKSGDGSLVRSEGSSAKVGKGGLAFGESQSTTYSDGETERSMSSSSQTKVGLSGASRSHESSVTGADGVTVADSRSHGVTRGDGRLGVTRTVARTVTRPGEKKEPRPDRPFEKADGHDSEVSTSSSSSRGIIAGKDGVGAYAETERSTERTFQNGVKTGAIGGLSGNVVVDVVEVSKEPPTYQVKVSVALGASLSGSLGYGGAGAKASGSASASMVVKKTLSAEATAAYVASLRRANAGEGAQRKDELGVIATGVTQGWSAARAVYDTMGGRGDVLAEGDSIEMSGEVEGGLKGSLKGDVGGIGLGVDVGMSSTASTSTTIEKKDGKLEVAKEAGRQDKQSGGLSVGLGIVKGGMSASTTRVSKRGLRIVLNPAAPKFAEQQRELMAATSDEALESFAKKWPDLVQGSSETEGQSGQNGASLGVGPAEATLGFSHGHTETVDKDKDGNVVGRTMDGQNTGSMSIGAFGYKVEASSKERALATVDKDGKASLDVSETRTDTDPIAFLSSLPGCGDKESAEDKAKRDGETGLLGKLAGQSKDKPKTTTQNVSGVRLSSDELMMLQAAAKDPVSWMKRCPSPRLMTDWGKARLEVIAAGDDQAKVARALTTFVGKDGHGRDEVLQSAAGHLGIGARYELPPGLAHLSSAHKNLIVDDPVRALDQMVADKGIEKATTAGRAVLAQLEGFITTLHANGHKFEEAGRHAEMLSRATDRKAQVEAFVRRVSGGKEADPRVRYNDVLLACQSMKAREDELFAAIAGRLSGHASMRDLIANGEDIRGLRELHAVWGPKYEELAGLAEEHKLGAGIYFKYQPDRERFQRALTGAPGQATEHKEAPAKKAAAKKPAVTRAPSDPVGASKAAVEKKEQGQASAIQLRVPSARNKAHHLGNKLFTALGKNRVAMGIDAHNRGMAKLRSADRMFERLAAATTADWNSYGFAAMQDYEAAAACFSEGMARVA